MPELRRNGRYVGASLGCEALRRVLWGVRWPHCLDARRCALAVAEGSATSRFPQIFVPEEGTVRPFWWMLAR